MQPQLFTDESPSLATRPRDRGFTLVEIVVAIVLLGTVGAAVVTSMSSSITASNRQRDIATATAWLQNATAVLGIMGRQLCTPDGESARIVYQDQLRSETLNADGWPSSRLSVEQVQFWNGAGWDGDCSGEIQRVRLRVDSPSGLVTQRLDVVVGDPYVELDQASQGGGDPASSCTVTSFTVRDKKGLGPVIPLKKPSTTKVSETKNKEITVTVTTSGICRGELRLSYQYPHKNHFHHRKPKLKPVKDQPGTYVAKIGKKDKYLVTTKIDITVQEHRRKSKSWTNVTNGVHVQALTFV